MDSGAGNSKASPHGGPSLSSPTTAGATSAPSNAATDVGGRPTSSSSTYCSSPTELEEQLQRKIEEVSKLTNDKIQLEEYTKETLQIFQQKYFLMTTMYTSQIQSLEKELASKKPGKNCLLPLAAASAPTNATTSEAGFYAQKPPPPLLGGPSSSSSSSATAGAASAPPHADAVVYAPKPPPSQLGGRASTSLLATAGASSAPPPSSSILRMEVPPDDYARAVDSTLWDEAKFLVQVKSQIGERDEKYQGLLQMIEKYKNNRNNPTAALDIIKFVGKQFRGHTDLLLGFAPFLPRGYTVERTLSGPVFAGPHLPDVKPLIQERKRVENTRSQRKHRKKQAWKSLEKVTNGFEEFAEIPVSWVDSDVILDRDVSKDKFYPGGVVFKGQGSETFRVGHY